MLKHQFREFRDYYLGREEEVLFEEHFPFSLESLDAYVPEKVRNEHTKAGWIQILPGQYQSDGFFIARFRCSRDEGAE